MNVTPVLYAWKTTARSTNQKVRFALTTAIVAKQTTVNEEYASPKLSARKRKTVRMGIYA